MTLIFMEHHGEIQVFRSQTAVPSQMCCVIYCLLTTHCDQRLCHHGSPATFTAIRQVDEMRVLQRPAM